MPGIAALAVIFLSGATASGIDQMANVKIHSPTSGTVSAVMADGQISLHHLVLRGLAKGRFPVAILTMNPGMKGPRRTIRKLCTSTDHR